MHGARWLWLLLAVIVLGGWTAQGSTMEGPGLLAQLELAWLELVQRILPIQIL